EAQRWLQSPDAADLGYDEVLAALVQTSRSEIDSQRAAARRRVRNTLVGLAGGFVVVACLAILAVLGWGNAQSREAEARKQQERAEGREADLEKAKEDQRRQHAESYARLATEAIKRGDWMVALEASAEALNDSSRVVTDEVGLRLVRVKALMAL